MRRARTSLLSSAPYAFPAIYTTALAARARFTPQFFYAIDASVFRFSFVYTQGASSLTSGGGDDDGVTIDTVLTAEVKKALKGHSEWEFDVWKVRGSCRPISCHICI